MGMLFKRADGHSRTVFLQGKNAMIGDPTESTTEQKRYECQATPVLHQTSGPLGGFLNNLMFRRVVTSQHVLVRVHLRVLWKRTT